MTDDRRHLSIGCYVAAWLALVLLIGLSLGSTHIGPNIWAPIIEFAIAAVQIAILFVLFMRLKGSPRLTWLFAGSGFLWLSFLYGLSMTDYATRHGWPWHG